MDFQERKKQVIKSEFTRQNKWDDESELTVKQQRVETAERMVRQKEQQSRAFRKALAQFDFDQVTIFETEVGEPVQEITPAKKAKCSSRQDRQAAAKAKTTIRQSGLAAGTPTDQLQERVDGTSCKIQGSIHEYIRKLEEKMASHREVQDRPDYAVMKYFSGLSDTMVEDYSSDDYLRRKKYLRRMTDTLMETDMRAEHFNPKLLAKSGDWVYLQVMRYKAFKEAYADPINKPYFDGLSSMEKQLIKVRILDMADLYENVLRFQCRCSGVDMDNGEFLRSDAELAAKPEELQAVHNFKEKIEYRNVQTRAIMASSYMVELTKEEQTLEEQQRERKESIEHGGEQELKGTGLTGFLVGYNPSTMNEIRQLFMDNAENYEANKPLLDLMEQEFFRVTDAASEYTRRTRAIDDIRSNVDPTGVYGTAAEKEFIKFFASESDKISLKQAIITNRLNTLRDGMKAIAKGRKPEDASVKKVIKEFRQKLGGKGNAQQAQIDEATAGWTQARMQYPEDPQFRAHERYTGTEDLREYLSYLTGEDQKKYTAQISSRIGLARMLKADVDAGTIKPLTHCIETSKGKISGLNLGRMVPNVEVLTVTAGISAEQAREMMRKMAAGEAGPEATLEKDTVTSEGLMEYKNAVYKHIKGLEKKYGKMLTQLHPEDVLRRINIHEFAMEARLVQDMVNLTDNNGTGIQLFTEDERDENYKTDMDYKALAAYYFNAIGAINSYVQFHLAYNPDPQIAAYQNDDMIRQMELARQYEDGVNEGPALRSSQMPYYVQSVRKRYQNNPHLLKRQGYGRW